MKVKVEAVIEVDSAYGDLIDKDEKEWFEAIMKDNKNTFLMLWSNDVGDEIGSTSKFKYSLIKK